MVSRKTVARMSRYRRLLASLHDEGVESIYSHQLARHAVVSAAQVRRDLMVIGYSGSPNRGYDVGACIESIGSFLGASDRQDVALVGVGNLGRAVLAHFAGESAAVAIVAAFDIDPDLTEHSVHGCRCFHASRMESLVRDLGIEDAELIKVEDFPTIMAYGVMSTPALAIDGKLVMSGKVPSQAEVGTLITTALAAQG